VEAFCLLESVFCFGVWGLFMEEYRLEYRVLSLGTDWHASNPSEKAKNGDKIPAELKELPDLQTLLNKAAEEGWQVVAVASCNSGISEVIVARRVGSNTQKV
jgi:hypothetical protein